VAGCAAVLAASCGLVSRRWLGGVTGDTLGATIQLTEIAALVGLVALR
jgi:cobalamin synthase